MQNTSIVFEGNLLVAVSRELSFIILLTIMTFMQYVKQNLIFMSVYYAYAKHGRNKSIKSRVLVNFDNTGYKLLTPRTRGMRSYLAISCNSFTDSKNKLKMLE